ncbi:NAD+ synthase [Thermococcus thioreducens]|uniref:NH(3)-dependent NAD(+) synthetase n=1 Tax=Thermococcus thioreducens TaxID=277988 RepID=A0A0Q2MQC0_9EURY|nr:NAD+ synthase [Thermococcus thioreducens]ASJ11518.1 NAD(+) synthetase [Thermococcus thioreducens]KQH81871.1 NAD synthetase [Thermococcus thioreducens]SEW05259.1 NH(3)-dependent NAD(+) synthetase [Thermococcus thioreducens]
MRVLDYGAAIDRITWFIREKVGEAGADGVVVGISGGIDSATVAHLAVRALGKDKVLGLIMPYYENGDLEDARLVCEALGIDYRVISIKPIVDEFERAVGGLDVKSRGNVMARTRMVLLYAHANAMNRLVLGTSNRSEVLTGYFTKWGDGASDYAPLINLYKTEVWEIAKLLGVPERIIKKKPTAGLWEGQTDEDELGISYRLLDEILWRMVDLGKEKSEIAEELGIPLERVEYVEKLIRGSEHKRRLPVGPVF